jgi:hypothetical protein
MDDIKWVPEWAKSYTIEGIDSAVIIRFCALDAVGAFLPAEELRAVLDRRDVGQQIREKPLADRMPKQERYKQDGAEEDFIDITYRQISWERFVGAMQWTIGKYFDRFGKKDDIVAEAYKIKDYSNRFYEKAVIEAAKRKKIDERA